MEYRKVMCVASRGRGEDNIQHFEARMDGLTNTITSVLKDVYLMGIEKTYFQQLKAHGIRLPAVLCNIRTDEGRKKRKQGIEEFKFRFLTPRTDGICGTLTLIQKDNLIMEKSNNNNMEQTYHEQPTKEDLLEYFSKRIRIRKMAPKEAGRLMGLEDSDIEKIEAYPFKSYKEREVAIAKADKKELSRIKRESICKTAQYKLYGNSIVCQCLTHIFANLFINAPKERTPRIVQLSLF